MALDNLSQSQWTEARERMFCEAVAVCAGIVPTAVSVVSIREKTGKRLLSIALELTVQIQVGSLLVVSATRQPKSTWLPAKRQSEGTRLHVPEPTG